MKNPIAACSLLIFSSACLFAADNELASDLERLNEAYRSNLESLQKRAVAAADGTTAKKVQEELARLATSSPAQPKNPAATIPGTLPANSTWQGNVSVKKERNIMDYHVKATILESDASGFTINARFLDREWVYKIKKTNNKFEIATAEAKSGAGIVKGMTTLINSSLEVVTEAGKESIKIRAVRKDGTIPIEASYDLRLDP